MSYAYIALARDGMEMEFVTCKITRRAFLGTAITAVPLMASEQGGPVSHAVYVLAGQDRFGEHKALGISTIDFKVSAKDSGGAALVIENTNRAKGGPARHLHLV